MSVVTKTFEEKTVRQMSLAIDVEVMESERSEAESIFWQIEIWLTSCMVDVPPRRQCVMSSRRLSVEEVVDSRGNIKSLNDEDNLEFIQQEQVQNSTVGTNRRSASSTFTAKKFHDPSESDDVEEESDEDDQEARDQRFRRDKERRKSRRKL